MSRHYREKGSWAWNGEIGPLLAEARERRGLSLKEAERSTSIRSRYLEGLERENPRELPGRGYVQGFLRSYAEFLNLDVEELSQKFKRHDEHARHREARNAAAEAGREASGEAVGFRSSGGWSSRSRGAGGAALVALSLVLVVLALVVAAFYFLRGDSLAPEAPVSGGEAPEQRAAEGGDPAGSLQDEPTPTLEESAEGVQSGSEGVIRARITVRGSESWISVESGSGVEYTGIAQPGFSRVFEAGRSLRITTGNAGAVELRLNGLEYGTLGESGEVTSRSFTLKQER